MDCGSADSSNPAQACLYINHALQQTGLFGDAKRALHETQSVSWRVAPEPFLIDQPTFEMLESIGEPLLRFYQGLQRLYEHSLRGKQPSWIKDYLEAGKPDTVLDYGKMRRFRSDFPHIIRPDILLTDQGLVISELDAVPGGFGLLAALSEHYSALGYELIGGRQGIVQGLARSIRSMVDQPKPTLAIIVSAESSDYLGEMNWISQALNAHGLRSFCLRPEDVVFQEDGLFAPSDGGLTKIDVIYRFFELFDLKNIPKIDLLLYAIRKQLVRVTPPLKSYLEEKLAFALFHHRALQGFWTNFLGTETYDTLSNLFPLTWVLDNRPLPPHAIIPDLTVGGEAVADWSRLKTASKQERMLVAKVSGFSENAWGSRGVSIGHDMSAEHWSSRIYQALAAFPDAPYVLQRFHKGVKVKTRYLDFQKQQVRTMHGRARLCPYYFVEGDNVTLAGILSTICPLDKKLIHGMVDAVMVPTAVSSGVDIT